MSHVTGLANNSFITAGHNLDNVWLRSDVHKSRASDASRSSTVVRPRCAYQPSYRLNQTFSMEQYQMRELTR
ncbi:hypothetical protein KIN20_025569 [Parelaphostrongylus tenuis]|nr:hypothetical protein KIN20_025569 [Parelaphostrongylus tenuis]